MRAYTDKHAQAIGVGVCVLVMFALTRLIKPGVEPSATPTNHMLTGEEQLTPETLDGAFTENSTGAIHKYLGNRVNLKGKVQSVGTNADGDPYLILDQKGRPTGMQCLFPVEAKPELAAMKAGESVSISGKVLNESGVHLTECQLK